jgi:hypothetical protein
VLLIIDMTLRTLASTLKCDPTPTNHTRYFIDHKFPIIGTPGTFTICFLLTKDLVAKVARYGYGKSSEKHHEERERDIAMHSFYPTTYARTNLMFFVADGRIYEIYIQERLYGPFTKGSFSESLLPKREPHLTHALMITDMVTANPDVQQFAWTKEGLLVGYDYL